MHNNLYKSFSLGTLELAHLALVMGRLGGLQDGKAGWIKTTLMLEEYLDGPEVDVDLVFSESRPVFGAITDNWPTVEPCALCLFLLSLPLPP